MLQASGMETLMPSANSTVGIVVTGGVCTLWMPMGLNNAMTHPCLVPLKAIFLKEWGAQRHSCLLWEIIRKAPEKDLVFIPTAQVKHTTISWDYTPVELLVRYIPQRVSLTMNAGLLAMHGITTK